jgi:hypothetical protein
MIVLYWGSECLGKRFPIFKVSHKETKPTPEARMGTSQADWFAFSAVIPGTKRIAVGVIVKNKSAAACVPEIRSLSMIIALLSRLDRALV